MISMTLFAMIITSVILAVQSLMIARTKTLNRVALLEELYFFSEQLFTGIKDGGTLDYEEYWNRKAVWITTQSGHYTAPTGVGNYGKNGTLSTTTYGTGIYLCRSNSWSSLPLVWMWTGGCLENHNNGGDGYLSGWLAPPSFSWYYQRYGEYLAQFTDYNGNIDDDLGNEDTDASGSIIWDDDDRLTGDVPDVFTGSVQELYLISKWAKTRTYFRWKIQQDPGSTITCSYTIPTNSWCIGNVQVLKLKWLDIGYSHTGAPAVIDSSRYDGFIDTWVCVEDAQCTWPTIGTKQIATGSGVEWVNMFPATINVKYLSFQAYPVKDPWLSWSAPDAAQGTTQISPFIHPYVRMNLEMWFSAGKRRTLRNEDPTISISTSISLADFE